MSEPRQKPGRSKQDYATPQCFIDATKRYLSISEFAIDLAADASNHKAPRWIDKETDALGLEWVDQMNRGQWAWLNPPFANIAPWAKKCAQLAKRNGYHIAFLVPAAVGSNWFRDYVYHADAHTLFLNGRLAFMPDKPTWLFPKDCMLVLYGFGNQGNAIWSWRHAD